MKTEPKPQDGVFVVTNDSCQNMSEHYATEERRFKRAIFLAVTIWLLISAAWAMWLLAHGAAWEPNQVIGE